MNTVVAKPATAYGWLDSFSVYLHPQVVAMLFLGFSAGLPLLLVFGTLSAWLRVEGLDKTTIGFVSWVTLAYGFKFAWAPLVDRLRLPLLTAALGQRRSWMLLAQAGVMAGLLAMAATDPTVALGTVVLCAVVTAFASATQDITIDAWRIEAAADDFQGAMAGTYQLGYRLGMIVAGGGSLVLADQLSWPAAYACMAALMLVGVAAALLIGEPASRRQEGDRQAERKALALLAGRRTPEWWLNLEAWCAARGLRLMLRRPGWWLKLEIWFVGAVISPFLDFFARHGAFALLILGFIMVFRLSDITLGVMANPFYIDMGYSLTAIGVVTKTGGVVVTIVGALLGGVLVVRYGALRMLMAGSLLVIATNLLFAWLALQEPLAAQAALPVWTLGWLALHWPLILVVGADNLAAGIAATTFIAYLSGLTNKAYTATQYALFSSIMLLLAKFIAGFSGAVVDASDYVVFFVYAAALGLPSVLLIMVLARHERARAAAEG